MKAPSRLSESSRLKQPKGFKSTSGPQRLDGPVGAGQIVPVALSYCACQASGIIPGTAAVGPQAMTALGNGPHHSVNH